MPALRCNARSSVGVVMTAVPRRAFFRRCLELLGARPGYVWGGKTAQGLDCSGFVTLALQLAGGADLRATHNTDKLWTEFPRVDAADVQPGDLVLYQGAFSKGPEDVEHVMVCAGFELCMGMAWGGSKDVDPEASRHAGKVALVRTLNYRPDLAGFVRLPLT